MAENQILQREMIEPEEFTSVFNPAAFNRKETYLLFEIQYEHRGKVWRACCKNSYKIHAEENFIQNVFKSMIQKSSRTCWITWYLSWSPCGVCAKKISAFLNDYPNVTLEIRICRLYKQTDPRNSRGLNELHAVPVYIYIMAEQDYRYCWRMFVNSEEPLRLSLMTIQMILFFQRELQIIIYGYWLASFLPGAPNVIPVTSAGEPWLLERKYWRKQAS